MKRRHFHLKLKLYTSSTSTLCRLGSLKWFIQDLKLAAQSKNRATSVSRSTTSNEEDDAKEGNSSKENDISKEDNSKEDNVSGEDNSKEDDFSSEDNVSNAADLSHTDNTPNEDDVSSKDNVSDKDTIFNRGSTSREGSITSKVNVSAKGNTSNEDNVSNEGNTTTQSKPTHAQVRLPSFSALDESLSQPSPPPHPLIRLNLPESAVEWDEASRLKLKYDPRRDNAGAKYYLPPLKLSASDVVDGSTLNCHVVDLDETLGDSETSGAEVTSEDKEGAVSGSHVETLAGAVKHGMSVSILFLGDILTLSAVGVRGSQESDERLQVSTSFTPSSTAILPAQPKQRLTEGLLELNLVPGLSKPSPPISKSLRQSFTTRNQSAVEPAPGSAALAPPSSTSGSILAPEARAPTKKRKRGQEKENESENDQNHVRIPRPLNSFFLFRKHLSTKIPASAGLNQQHFMKAIGELLST